MGARSLNSGCPFADGSVGQMERALQRFSNGAILPRIVSYADSGRDLRAEPQIELPANISLDGV